MSANRRALKHIKQSSKKSQIRTGGKSLQIPIGNLVLLRDHPKGHNKIQDNSKSELFVVVDHHKDPNVYVIQSLNKKGPKKTVNRQQLFHLKKSQGDPLTSDPSTKGPKFEPKIKKKWINPTFVIHMALGWRPRLPQPLYSQSYLTPILNRGGILV